MEDINSKPFTSLISAGGELSTGQKKIGKKLLSLKATQNPDPFKNGLREKNFQEKAQTTITKTGENSDARNAAPLPNRASGPPPGAPNVQRTPDLKNWVFIKKSPQGPAQLSENNNVLNFIEQQCQNVDVGTAKARIKNGEAFAKKLMTADKSAVEEIILKGAYNENKAINLAWFFIAKGVAQGDDFTSGAMQINDPSGNILKFLSGLPKSYERISSHAKKDRQKIERGGIARRKLVGILAKPFGGTQLGVDLRDKGLPIAGKHTILFGGVTTNKKGDKPALYFKLEGAGSPLPTNFKAAKEFAKHGVAFIKSRRFVAKLIEKGKIDKSALVKRRDSKPAALKSLLKPSKFKALKTAVKTLRFKPLKELGQRLKIDTNIDPKDTVAVWENLKTKYSDHPKIKEIGKLPEIQLLERLATAEKASKVSDKIRRMGLESIVDLEYLAPRGKGPGDPTERAGGPNVQ